MSPPIRDGSGNDIGAIRLGDGSEISEVRTGAGDVLFSAIPDNVIDDFEETIYEDKGNSVSDYYTLGGDANNFDFFQRSTSTAYEGLYGIDGDSNSSDDRIVTSVSGDGLPRYPSIDDRVRISLNFSDTSNDIFWIGTTIGSRKGWWTGFYHRLWYWNTTWEFHLRGI